MIDDTTTEPPAAVNAPPSPAAKVARIRCLGPVRALGFTFAKGKVVEGVPLAHAEYLAGKGEAEILQVY